MKRRQLDSCFEVQAGHSVSRLVKIRSKIIIEDWWFRLKFLTYF